MRNWWRRYFKDTIGRMAEFRNLRTNTIQTCFVGDSRNVDIINLFDKKLEKIVRKNKIKGIFTSPPYIGMIDYHKEHEYAYEIFGFGRRDSLEIGSKSGGKSKSAVNNYINDISAVLINARKYMVDDYVVFLVANDKENVYPKIADISGMYIAQTYERPVLNRSEGDGRPYIEKNFV